MTDDLGATASATGTITVLANRPPTPVDDVVRLTQPSASTCWATTSIRTTIPSPVTGVSQPGHGTASCGPDGGCLYVAAAGYAGPDQFSYTVSDGKGGTASASVTVDVRIRTIGGATNLAAIKDVLVTTVGVAESVDALANDSGAGPLVLVSNTDPGHGTVVCSPAGLCTYTPAPGFSGYDGFTYVVSDGTGASATAAVEITVAAAANHLPDVAGAPATIVQGATANWIVAAAPTPAGAPGTAPGLQRQLSVALTGNHQLVPGSLTTASGWTSTVTPSGVTLTAGPEAMLGESASQVLPAPSNPISQGSGGDGHVPILVGSGNVRVLPPPVPNADQLHRSCDRRTLPRVSDEPQCGRGQHSGTRRGGGQPHLCPPEDHVASGEHAHPVRPLLLGRGDRPELRIDRPRSESLQRRRLCTGARRRQDLGPVRIRKSALLRS